MWLTRLQARFLVKSGLFLSCLMLTTTVLGQSAEETTDLRTLVMQLQAELKQTRQELATAQSQIRALSDKINNSDKVNNKAPAEKPAPAESTGPGSTYMSPVDVQRSAEASQEQETDPNSLLRAKVEEQQQTKVESASKYRVKLSGLVLFNAFSNRGTVDLVDIPNRAFNSSGPGASGATMRQTILGLELIGPTIANGRTTAGINVDFAGGFPTTHFGVTNGVLRLREAYGRVDWDKTSVTVGQVSPIISPFSPTSYATLAEPAFSWAGNLWVWTPQFIAEHRFQTGDSSYFSISGAVMVPLTEEIPRSSQFAPPDPGQLSHRPAFAATTSWRGKWNGETVQFGLGGYNSRLDYGFGRTFQTWAATAYWKLPFTRYLELSGEAYRGRGVGGLGGGIWQTAIYDGNPDLSSTTVRPLNGAGGWAQLKFHPLPKLEFNGAFGQDNALAYDFRFAPQIVGEYAIPLARNRATFGNAIYHIKSNVLVSLEYRKLWTYRYTGLRNTADQVNIAAGVSF